MIELCQYQFRSTRFVFEALPLGTLNFSLDAALMEVAEESFQFGTKVNLVTVILSDFENIAVASVQICLVLMGWRRQPGCSAVRKLKRPHLNVLALGPPVAQGKLGKQSPEVSTIVDQRLAVIRKGKRNQA